MNNILLDLVTYFNIISLNITDISCSNEKIHIKYEWNGDLEIPIKEHSKNLNFLILEKYKSVKWIDFATGNVQIGLQ